MSPSAGHQNQKQNLTGALASSSVKDIRSDFQLLPSSCAGCFAMKVSTTVSNLDNLLKLMNVTLETVPSEITARSVYLMGRTKAEL